MTNTAAIPDELLVAAVDDDWRDAAPVDGGWSDVAWVDADLDDWMPSATTESEIDDAFTRVEALGTEVTMAAAQKYAAIDDALIQAGRAPEVFVGSAGARRSDAVEFARRSAVCELALRLGISESALRSLASMARTLRTSLPAVWTGFRDGVISEQKIRIILDVASGMAEGALPGFDDAVRAVAIRLTPPKLKSAALALREKLDPRPATIRHENAASDRRTWLEPAPDGMCWLGAYLPADAGMRASARLDANARTLTARPGETRTLAQARADVLADLLTGDGTSSAVTSTVTVTVPVTTLLHQDTPDDYRRDPATLNGYGPVDPDTARRLCAKAPSLYRLLTDPIDGAILTVDRKSYRPPADLKRLLRAIHPRCSFPGCNRRADESDIDHTLDWLHNGRTELGNLAPLCRHHHRVKHNTLWTMRRDPGIGPAASRITWTAPTGTSYDSDPPPF